MRSTQERDFCSDPAPHKGCLFLSCFFSSLWFFDGNVTSKTQRFLLSWSDSRCYTVFVKISTFFHNFLSFLYPSSSAYIKFSLVFFAIWPFCSEGVQSHSSTTPVVKWITLVFEVNPLKIVEEDIASILPPFSVAPRPIWSNLELERRGETVWR